jgi:hypothetical protein
MVDYPQKPEQVQQQEKISEQQQSKPTAEKQSYEKIEQEINKRMLEFINELVRQAKETEATPLHSDAQSVVDQFNEFQKAFEFFLPPDEIKRELFQEFKKREAEFVKLTGWELEQPKKAEGNGEVTTRGKENE